MSVPEYVPGKSIKGSIKLSSNENPLGTSPRALKALQENMQETHLYPPIIFEELQKKCALWRGVQQNEIIFGNGSNEIFMLCAAACIENGTNAIGSAHTFSQYSFVTELFGGEFRPQAMKDMSYDIEAIVDAIDNHTRIVFLCSPNNPTGKIISHKELTWALQHIPETVLVVLDQAYGEYVTASTFIDGAKLITHYPNILVTGTFSKIFGMAALRLGYGLGTKNIISVLSKLKPPFNVNRFAMIAANAAIDDVDFIKKSIDSNMESKALLYEGLKALNIEYYPTHGNFICIRNPPKMNIFHILQQHNITIRELVSFHLPEYVRMTIPPVKQVYTILNILNS